MTLPLIRDVHELPLLSATRRLEAHAGRQGRAVTWMRGGGGEGCQ